MRNKIISIMFCFLLALGIGLSVLISDRQYSEGEKRTLAQFPEVSWDGIRTGEFGDAMETYLADQFPGRDGWVTVKTITDRCMGKKESGGAYFADDGYLIEIHRSFPEEQTMANLQAVKQLSDAMAEKGVPVKVMLVPTAADILSDRLPAFAPNGDQQRIISLAKEQGLDVVDVTEALTAHKEEYIYYRTDHHWTSLGAYYGYAAWMEAKGMKADSIDSWTREQLSDDFRGTTYAKVNYPFAPYDEIDAYYKQAERRVDYNEGYYVTDSIYERTFLEGSDQYGVFFNSNQSVTVAEGEGEGKLLILKDSYANCFAQFTVDDHKETHMIDMRFFRGSVKKYIEAQGITEVLVLYNIPNFTKDTGITRCGK